MQICGLSHQDREQKTQFYLQNPYAVVFAPEAIQNIGLRKVAQPPAPYVIEAPLVAGRTWLLDEILSFDVVLMGAALEQLSTLVLAWRRAFLRGIGNGDGTDDLVSIEHLPAVGKPQVICSEDHPRLAQHHANVGWPKFNAAQSVHLQLLTPLRLQQRGNILGPRDLSAGILLRNLIRLVSVQLQQRHPEDWPMDRIRALNNLADDVEDDRRLVWQDWERYTSRQNQEMNLGGVVGRWYLKQVPAELLPFIYLGQWLHLGKETAFGLGKYQWTSEP